MNGISGAIGLEAKNWDYLIVGAGTAGIPAAIFGSRRGARVLLIDAAPKIGGTLHIARGQISAAGTHIQKAKGIDDSVNRHYDDVIRLTQGTTDSEIVKLAVTEAPATLNWLLEAGLVPLPDHPVTGASQVRPGYSTPRYLWGENAGKSILAVLERELASEVASGRVEIKLSTRAIELLTGSEGSVIGVRALGAEETIDYYASHVLLTTGGYAMNPTLFEQLTGAPAYVAGAYPFSRGDGLTLATALDVPLRGHDRHRAGSGSILSQYSFPADIYARFSTAPQERMPWEVWVNVHGRRFIGEDNPSNFERESTIAAQPKLRYAIVFDDKILQSAPLGISGWTREQMLSHFNSHPMFTCADSLEILAKRAGLDPEGLGATIGDYNSGVARNVDSFGRKFLPLQIKTPPFYAITLLGHSSTSAVGLTVDSSLRVINRHGNPIPGLYAAGEILGSGVTLGKAFAPGMLLTPALAFGRLLGNQLPIGTS